MLPIFVLLWYLPAAGRTGSPVRPLALPLLSFAVGDVSLLGLRPVPRAARGMYAICVLRVVVLVALALACRRPSWPLCAAATVALSLLWAAATAALLCGSTFARRRKFRQPDCLEEIRSLAEAVEEASQLEPPEACRRELVRLREQNPGLVLTSVFNTVGPAWAVLLHFAMDAGNVASLAVQGRWTLALPLALSLANSASYLHRKMRGPHRLPLEVVLSLRRGLATAEYMEAIRGDKAVLRIPETILKVYALPFGAGGSLPAVFGVGAILGNVLLVAKFIFCELDLDIHSIEDADKSAWGVGDRTPKRKWKWKWK